MPTQSNEDATYVVSLHQLRDLAQSPSNLVQGFWMKVQDLMPPENSPRTADEAAERIVQSMSDMQPDHEDIITMQILWLITYVPIAETWRTRLIKQIVDQWPSNDMKWRLITEVSQTFAYRDR